MSSDAATIHSHLHVDVVLYPGVMVGWALAFVDLIQAVNTIAELQSGRAAQLISWQLVDERLQRLDHK